MINKNKYERKFHLKRPLYKTASLKKTKIGVQEQLSLNAGQKYCNTAILSTFIELPFVIKIFVLSIFEWLSRTNNISLEKHPSFSSIHVHRYGSLCCFYRFNGINVQKTTVFSFLVF